MQLLRRAVLVAVVPMIGALMTIAIWALVLGGPSSGLSVPRLLSNAMIAVPICVMLAVVAAASYWMWLTTNLAAREADADRRQLHGLVQALLTLGLSMLVAGIGFASIDAAAVAGGVYLLSAYPLWAFLAGFKWAPRVRTPHRAAPEPDAVRH